MVLIFDTHTCTSSEHLGNDSGHQLRSPPPAFNDWRGVEPRLARTLRRLGFSAALATPRYTQAPPSPPTRRSDATTPEWRPL